MNFINSEECQALRLQFSRIRILQVRKYKQFRVRSASKSKNGSNIDTSGKKQTNSLIKNNKDHDRSNSLKSISGRKLQIRKLNTNADQSDEQKMVFQKVLKTQSDNFEKKQNKRKQKIKELQQIFNIKTIMKMKNKKNQKDSQSIVKEQQKKRHSKGQFRMNKFLDEQRQLNSINDLQSLQYWKKVNQSLILAENETNFQQPSKDLKQIYSKLNFI